MTLEQKLQADLLSEEMRLNAAMQKMERAEQEVTAAKTAIHEHEIRIAYIKQCLPTIKVVAAPTSKPAGRTIINGDDAIDISAAMDKAFSQTRRMKMNDIVDRLMGLGYGGSLGKEKVRKNASSFLLRKVKQPETNYRKAGRGIFEFAESN